MAVDKVEAVKKATETMSKQSNPAGEMEHMAPNKEQFQTLMNSSQPVTPTSFERIDTKSFATDEVQSLEKPVFSEENVSSQKSGSATDQEGKKRGQQQETEEVEGVSSTKRSKQTSPSTSLMDEVTKLNKNVSNISNASPEGIKAQVKDVIAQIDQVKTQLAQAQTEIKPSYQTLLRNRLTHIDDNLKIALSKAGVEYTPPPTVANSANANPLQRFMQFLTNSQKQLENLHQTVDQVNSTGVQLTAANMLALQMKMSYVQQQIELFTSLLNKALESTKTIMNVQV